MTVLIRNALGELKTFMEISAGTVLEPGETMEEVDISFRDYANRLRLFCARPLRRVDPGSRRQRDGDRRGGLPGGDFGRLEHQRAGGNHPAGGWIGVHNSEL